MEAVLDIKAPIMTGQWTSKLFRLRDRRLIYFNQNVIDFHKTIDSAAKCTLELTHLISLSISKQHDKVLILTHPKVHLDFALRFKTDALFMSFLKVLSTFSRASIQNAPIVDTCIPSNYAYSIWNVLQSLYTHPSLTKTIGLFRIPTNKANKQSILNHLLQQTYNVQKLKKHKNIHMLANIFCDLLSNLPSTIFKEKQIVYLIDFYHVISKRKKSQKIANISTQVLNKLKAKIEELYRKDKSRYGLMTLTFHLLKQIISHQAHIEMNLQSLSRIFVPVLESRLYLIECGDTIQTYRMQYLLQTLIYHAYFIFPQQQWHIHDIVIAAPCETEMIKIYLRYSRSLYCRAPAASSPRLDKEWSSRSISSTVLSMDSSIEDLYMYDANDIKRNGRHSRYKSDSVVVSAFAHSRKSGALNSQSTRLQVQRSMPDIMESKEMEGIAAPPNGLGRTRSAGIHAIQTNHAVHRRGRSHGVSKCNYDNKPKMAEDDMNLHKYQTRQNDDDGKEGPNTVDYDGIPQEHPRKDSIVTTPTSCCTLLACGCTNYTEPINIANEMAHPSNKAKCLGCNHPKDAHKIRIWL